jgi:hypothetical protein
MTSIDLDNHIFRDGWRLLMGRSAVLAALSAVLNLSGCAQDAAVKSSAAPAADSAEPVEVVATTTASAQAPARPSALAGWVKYVSPKCGYEIMMPSGPKDVAPPRRPGSRVSYDMMRGGEEPTFVQVICADLPGPPADVAGTRVAAIQAGLDQGGWEKTAQRETKIAGHSATEATGVQADKHVLMLGFFVEARSYTVILATGGDPAMLEEAKATFKLLPGQ